MSTRTRRGISTVSGAFALAALAACADHAPPTAAPDDPALARGGSGGMMSDRSGMLYRANLHPLNVRAQQVLDPDMEAGGPAHGKAYFRIEGGTLTATVEMNGVEPMMIHPQHIHAADRCPPASADTNGDGFIDVIEGVPFYGPILVPLDGDISNTVSEPATFPNPGSDTEYFYSEQTSLDALTTAIGGPLNLAERHVVVHGVDPDTPLPPSVKSLGGLPAYLTLPVACGEIRQVRR